MSSSHHGVPSDRDPGKEEIVKRFLDQLEKRAKREYTHGRISGQDEGTLALAVAADKANGVVIIDFGKPVEWIGLGEKECKGLIQMLIEKLREIATQPFSLDV